ncbi:hypothetical protein HYH03_014123 [Edaphochlamys debaryana]|uniref:Swiss Army Knife 2H phosphoesterase domain-containing protein n=1 Tax=Edaphochlamys debaryana TaxID=47281 RepID=A0A835XPP9_9CHLO|nr:hypothetical protein HYH03_014123 [Edaphochlamys debaryana]|eukprot:KAG2487282.1 hypothetical protein HYH03_014123 [Edaphochlamys debaryana]
MTPAAPELWPGSPGPTPVDISQPEEAWAPAAGDALAAGLPVSTRAGELGTGHASPSPVAAAASPASGQTPMSVSEEACDSLLSERAGSWAAQPRISLAAWANLPGPDLPAQEPCEQQAGPQAGMGQWPASPGAEPWQMVYTVLGMGAASGAGGSEPGDAWQLSPPHSVAGGGDDGTTQRQGALDGEAGGADAGTKAEEGGGEEERQRSCEVWWPQLREPCRYRLSRLADVDPPAEEPSLAVWLRVPPLGPWRQHWLYPVSAPDGHQDAGPMQDAHAGTLLGTSHAGPTAAVPGASSAARGAGAGRSDLARGEAGAETSVAAEGSGEGDAASGQPVVRAYFWTVRPAPLSCSGGGSLLGAYRLDLLGSEPDREPGPQPHPQPEPEPDSRGLGADAVEEQGQPREPRSDLQEAEDLIRAGTSCRAGTLLAPECGRQPHANGGPGQHGGAAGGHREAHLHVPVGAHGCDAPRALNGHRPTADGAATSSGGQHGKAPEGFLGGPAGALAVLALGLTLHMLHTAVVIVTLTGAVVGLLAGARVWRALQAAGAWAGAQLGLPPAPEEAERAYAAAVEAAVAARLARLQTTPLHVAAVFGPAAAVQARAAAQSGSLDAADRNGNTPLALAVLARSVAAARELVVAGADPKARCRDGRNPLELAERSGVRNLVAALKEAAAQPTAATAATAAVAEAGAAAGAAVDAAAVDSADASELRPACCLQLKLLNGGESYVGLFGGAVEAVAQAAMASGAVPAHHAANRVKRDGPSHHITLITPPEMHELRKKHGMSPERAFEGVVAQIGAAGGAWLPLGVGRADSRRSGDEARYLVVAWPAGREARAAVGLAAREQPFHVTLGFDLQDVHGVPKGLSTLVGSRVDPGEVAALVEAMQGAGVVMPRHHCAGMAVLQALVELRRIPPAAAAPAPPASGSGPGPPDAAASTAPAFTALEAARALLDMALSWAAEPEAVPGVASSPSATTPPMDMDSDTGDHLVGLGLTAAVAAVATATMDAEAVRQQRCFVAGCAHVALARLAAVQQDELDEHVRGALAAASAAEEGPGVGALPRGAARILAAAALELGGGALKAAGSLGEAEDASDTAACLLGGGSMRRNESRYVIDESAESRSDDGAEAAGPCPDPLMELLMRALGESGAPPEAAQPVPSARPDAVGSPRDASAPAAGGGAEAAAAETTAPEAAVRVSLARVRAATKASQLIDAARGSAADLPSVTQGGRTESAGPEASLDASVGTAATERCAASAAESPGTPAGRVAAEGQGGAFADAPSWTCREASSAAEARRSPEVPEDLGTRALHIEVTCTAASPRAVEAPAVDEAESRTESLVAPALEPPVTAEGSGQLSAAAVEAAAGRLPGSPRGQAPVSDTCADAALAEGQMAAATSPAPELETDTRTCTDAGFAEGKPGHGPAVAAAAPATGPEPGIPADDEHGAWRGRGAPLLPAAEAMTPVPAAGLAQAATSADAEPGATLVPAATAAQAEPGATLASPRSPSHAAAAFASNAAVDRATQVSALGAVPPSFALDGVDSGLLRSPGLSSDLAGSRPLTSAEASLARSESLFLRNPLLLAARSGDSGAVQALAAAEGLQLDAADEDGETALHMAVSSSTLAAVKALIDAGASVHATDSDGRTPLHSAALAGAVLAAKALVAAGANLDRPDKHGRSPLHAAVLSGCLPAVRALLEAGAEPNAAGRRGRTPLIEAVHRGCAGAVRALVAAGACVGAADEAGRTALHVAAASPHAAAVLPVLLQAESGRLAAGAVDREGRTPLHAAAVAGRVMAVKALVDAGARLRPDKSNRTPLHAAAHAGAPEVAAALLEAPGVWVDAADRDGRTALHLAVSGGNTELARELVAAGADPDVRDRFRQTPRNLAAGAGDPALLEALTAGAAAGTAAGAAATTKSTWLFASTAKTDDARIPRGQSSSAMDKTHGRPESPPRPAFRLPPPPPPGTPPK